MARERAVVVAEWEQAGAERRPKLAVPLPDGASAMDVTSQPAPSLLPSPNCLLVEVWADGSYLDALPPGDVLSREAMDG